MTARQPPRIAVAAAVGVLAAVVVDAVRGPRPLGDALGPLEVFAPTALAYLLGAHHSRAYPAPPGASP